MPVETKFPFGETHFPLFETFFPSNNEKNGKFIQNKIDNFSHQEINITEEEIKERMDKGIDISGNHSVLYNNVKIKDNNYLPPNICLLSSLFNFI